jgi:hypothetical protein
MVNRPEIVALREAYAGYARSPKRERPPLVAFQPLVCSVVDVMKEEGWPPERVIVAVKAIARDAGLSPSSEVMLAHFSLDELDDLLTSSVRWCIERYYDVAAIEVATKDGQVFRCRRVLFPSNGDSDAAREVRWVFSDANGVDHVGPIVLAPLSAASLALLVDDWWAMKKAMTGI